MAGQRFRDRLRELHGPDVEIVEELSAAGRLRRTAAELREVRDNLRFRSAFSRDYPLRVRLLAGAALIPLVLILTALMAALAFAALMLWFTLTAFVQNLGH